MGTHGQTDGDTETAGGTWMGRWAHIDPRGQTDRQMVAHRQRDGDRCVDI